MEFVVVVGFGCFVVVVVMIMGFIHCLFIILLF